MGRSAQVLRVAATYVGTVVGAGFASGQESLRFFAAYGRAGVWGAALATLLFCFYGFVVLELGHALRARSHREVLLHACGPRAGQLADVAVTTFLFAGLTVMLAGAGALVQQQLGLPAVAGTLLTVVATLLTVLYGLEGIMAANSVVVPVLAAAVLALCATSLHYHGLDLVNPGPAVRDLQAGGNWFVAAWLYVAYNLILSISVLAPLGAAVSSRRRRLAGALLGGLCLGVLALAIKLAVAAHLPEAGRFPVPMLFLARTYPLPVQLLYTLVLWAEIYTTACAGAFGVARRLTDGTGWRYAPTVTTVVLLAIAGSGFGFARLVGTLYPAFGYLSLGLLALLARYGLFGRRYS